MRDGVAAAERRDIRKAPRMAKHGTSVRLIAQQWEKRVKGWKR